MKCIGLVLMLGVLTWAVSSAPAMDVTQITRPGGLAIISGEQADAAALALVSEGRWLVRIIAADEDQAASLRAATQSMTPLVTVSVTNKGLPLPPIR